MAGVAFKISYNAWLEMTSPGLNFSARIGRMWACCLEMLVSSLSKTTSFNWRVKRSGAPKTLPGAFITVRDGYSESLHDNSNRKFAKGEPLLCNLWNLRHKKGSLFQLEFAVGRVLLNPS